MKKVFFIGLFLAALTFSACHQCQNFTRVEQAPIIKEYFRNYKPGTYWIYLNRDSSKRYSVWISDYVLTTGKDRLDQCLEMEKSQFKVNAEYLSQGTPFKGEIGPNGEDFEYTVAKICNYSFFANAIDSSFRIGSQSPPFIIKKKWWCVRMNDGLFGRRRFRVWARNDGEKALSGAHFGCFPVVMAGLTRHLRMLFRPSFV